MSSKEKKPAFSWRLITDTVKNARRVYTVIWPEKKIKVIVGYFCVIITSSGDFLKSGALALLVNELTAGGDINRLIYLVVLAVLAILIPALLFQVEEFNNSTLYMYLEKKFDILINQKKSVLEIAAHEDPPLRDLITRVVENGIWRVQSFVDRWFYVIQAFSGLVISAVVLLILNYWVFIIVFVTAIPLLFVELRYSHNVWTINAENSQRRRRYWDARNLLDTKEAVAELKIFQNAGFFLRIIEDILTSWQKDRLINERKRFVWRFFAALAGLVAIAASLAIFVRSAVIGDIQPGTLIFALSSVFSFQSSVSGFFGFLSRQYQDSLFVTDVFKFLDIPQALPMAAAGRRLEKNSVPEIVFENVSFSYPQAPANMVIRNFSFTIKPGEKLAIIGVNGAGKTTLVKLLCRFYDPTKGRILIDGVDLKEIDLDSWYNKLGAIFQDFSRYYFKVKDLISLGRSDIKASKQKVVAAAEKSESDDFIRDWTMEYEQMLGSHYSGGIDPSVGQWQKLALARTFYRDPDVFILDEPTSSIDAEAEEKIFERLGNVAAGKTVILISHRFSTVRRADKIIVIENGVIGEYGTHEELLANKKTYERLFRLQAKGYR
ncbi:MAG: ABC transporter ATP-binding protein [Candidatus Magasanikbacteria bacterium]|nr:ABC transporter ATP-binding protein [Candidatus Magasanikbacteria bacterium]